MPEIIRLDLNSFGELVKRQTINKSAFELALVIQDILSDGGFPESRGMRRLDFLFHEYRSQNASNGDFLETVCSLNDFLYKTKKFEVTDKDAIAAEEIFPGYLLEKRQGSALAMSFIYRELLQKLQVLPSDFVNFPGANLVKVLYRHQLLFLDPGSGGRLMKVADLQNLLSRRYGRNTLLSGTLLETPTDFQVLSRYLTKLKTFYFESRDWQKLLAVLDMLVMIHPLRMSEYKERGLLLYQLGFFDEAHLDLQYFIVRSRPSPEIEKLRKLMSHLRV